MIQTLATRKVQWHHVFIYYLIACVLSWPFFWWRDILHWQGFRGPGAFKVIPIMWGPGIAGLVCLWLFRKKHLRTVSLLGSHRLYALMAWFVPLLLLAAFGIKDVKGQPDHTTPLLLSVFGFFTVLGEEVGWRGFLQDALRPLKPVWRYTLIGTLWELWHFTNRTHDRTVLQIVLVLSVTIPATILISVLIGMAVARSKSVLVAAALHGWLDLLFEFPGMPTYLCAGAAVLLWSVLLYKWPQRQPVVEGRPQL